MNAAYNYPARVSTRCPWNVYFDASFIFWQPLEENLELGVVNNVPTSGPATTINGHVVAMDCDYKPGFRLGVGGFFDYDNWDTHAEYTWFHTTNHQHTSVGVSATPTQTILPMWGNPGFTGAFVYDSARAKWHMNMDIIDLDLGRWCYVGTKLVVRPSLGARAAFIRQNYNITYQANSPFPDGSSTFRSSYVSSNSHSWGVGVESGLEADWLVGYGLRLFGTTEADILFTRYTSLRSHESSVSLAPSTAALPGITIKQNKYNAVRTHVDFQVGFGWGTYWLCNSLYTDLALGYEFQVFFDQNMFRHFNDDIMTANSTMSNGNLYTQGMTLKFMIQF
ncbi:MAG TPA: Lpg1974 family pore-forming outer membrane protein [Chlamydiales bacterium]|nr:Lpg1974 family pore-forming outer membrane protein [Chlamydiales bacterium]